MKNPSLPAPPGSPLQAVLSRLRRLTRHKRLFNLMRIAVSLILIVTILLSVDLQQLGQAMARARVWYLVAALGVSFAGVIVRAYRWQILLEDQQVRASMSELSALWFVSFLFTNLLPSGIGGDAIKVYELRRSHERGAQAVSSVLVDRFMGLFALQAIGLVALGFSWWLIPTQLVVLTIIVFGVSLLVAWLVSARPVWNFMSTHLPLAGRLLSIQAVRALFDSLQSYRRLALLRAFGVGLVFNAFLIGMNVLIGQGLGIELPLNYYMIFVPITSVVLLLPISFAGLGVREFTYVGLFTQALMVQMTLPQETARSLALSLSLLVYVIGTVSPGIVGGIIYILRAARVHPAHRAVEE